MTIAIIGGRSARQFDRLEFRRQDHFQQFNVVGVIQDQVLDTRGWVQALPSLINVSPCPSM
jgi:hypothetical protein